MIALLTLAVASTPPAPICTDRPAKANAVCTVPAGLVQVEGSLADWSRGTVDGGRSTTLALAPTVVKLGLTDASDVEVAWTPLVRVRARSAGQESGAGDLLVRLKQRLTRSEAPVQAAVIPFVKLPTAAYGLGNGKLEGGIAVPMSLGAGRSLTVTLGPEVDLLADGHGRGRHLAVTNLVNLSAPIAKRLTLSGELWSNLNFDPAGTVRQASADVAISYLVSNSIQLDAGISTGLTRATPGVEIYAGASFRF